MVKPITKKYLKERTSFLKQSVIKAVDFDGLWAIVKQMEPADQLAIFKIVDHELNPLSENQIDSLFAYLPNEVREGLDFISMDKSEKLDIVRENKPALKTIIEKKGYTELVDLDRSQVNPVEEYSSAKLWDIIKTGKYDLS